MKIMKPQAILAIIVVMIFIVVTLTIILLPFTGLSPITSTEYLKAFLWIYGGVVVGIIVGYLFGKQAAVRREVSEPKLDAAQSAEQHHTAIEENRTEHPKVFISHAHTDENIAKALVDVIEQAFVVRPEDIRVTSLPGHRVPIGANITGQLRQDVQGASVVLGIMTPDSIESTWVVFELGASWALHKPTYPLLARGTTVEDIPDPIKDLRHIYLRGVHDYFL